MNWRCKTYIFINTIFLINTMLFLIQLPLSLFFCYYYLLLLLLIIITIIVIHVIRNTIYNIIGTIENTKVSILTYFMLFHIIIIIFVYVCDVYLSANPSFFFFFLYLVLKTTLPNLSDQNFILTLLIKTYFFLSLSVMS